MMETVQIRLPKDKVRLIDREVKAGRFASRSDAVRAYIDQAHLQSVMNEFQRIAESDKLSREDVRRAAKNARVALYKRYL